MEAQKYEFTELSDDFKFTASAGSNDYVPAPVDEPLKAHISSLKETETIDTFKEKQPGVPNPNYNKPKKVLVVGFKLDESDAEGQEYTKWISYAVNERSNLGRISKVIWGDPMAITQHTAKDLLGKPVRISLTPSKNNPDKLVVDLEKIMKPSADQKEVVIIKDVVLEDIPEDNDALEAFNKAIAGN